MTSTIITIMLVILLLAVGLALILIWREKNRIVSRVQRLNDDLIDVSGDSSVGRRLSDQGSCGISEVAKTINRLFDAIGERDEEIDGRDRLFTDFVQTLPEIVLVHDEHILLANESAASLIGLNPEQLQGREVADLVKPAYRALFRKTMAKHLSNEPTPERLEIQLINGDDTGLWVEVQSTVVEHHGSNAILTIARDVSHRKNLEVSLSRSKRQAQYTLESISESVITTDNEGRIDYMNHATEAMLGANRDDASGHNTGEFYSLIDEVDRRGLGDPVERCLSIRSRIDMGRRALLVSRGGAHEHSVEITALPIKGPG
jgi:PAS domain S-box-containing protein